MSTNRFLLVKSGCSFCREFVKIVTWINLKLPIDKQIKIMDNIMFEDFGLIQYPIMNKIFKTVGEISYPFLYIDAIVVEPCQKEMLKPFLEEFVKEDLII